MTKYINEDLEISSHEENSDEDSIFEKTIQEKHFFWKKYYEH